MLALTKIFPMIITLIGRATVFQRSPYPTPIMYQAMWQRRIKVTGEETPPWIIWLDGVHPPGPCVEERGGSKGRLEWGK